jgi:hypothetical protein
MAGAEHRQPEHEQIPGQDATPPGASPALELKMKPRNLGELRFKE